MVFSSLVFILVFLPVVLICDHFVPCKYKNLFLLIANFVFYAYGEPRYIVVMIASIIVNYLAAIAVEDAMTARKRKAVLALSVVLNIGALCFFKYTMLFADTLRRLPIFSSIPVLKIVLPIGISFYTFQAMSYVIDVYRGDCRATRNLIDFAAYISLFPQLIAGPIVRYSDVDRQLYDRRESVEMFSNGVRLFAIGLAKKVLLANRFGIVWNTVSADVNAYGTVGAWLGAVAYALQIYFDFAGYSDMARGLGKMLGFDFCLNFTYPYISKSITEFWRRWHISLSTWFRDYVYIPLGGNRIGKIRSCINILIVWALTGLWHGAGWNFLAWGMYYGVLLLLEKTVYGKKLASLPSVFGYVYTIVVVIVGWIFFASPSFSAAFRYLHVMFVPANGDFSSLVAWIPTILIGIVASTPLFAAAWGILRIKRRLAVTETLLCLASLVLCVASLVMSSYNPFLYFRF